MKCHTALMARRRKRARAEKSKVKGADSTADVQEASSSDLKKKEGADELEREALDFLETNKKGQNG